MTETTQTERDHLRSDLNHDRHLHPFMVAKVINDADRLAQYERDLHDDIGKDRSQDTDWLRAGFLRRGAEIERLDDGIRALADNLAEEVDSHSPNKSFDQYGGGCAYKAEQIEQELRDLLDGE